VTFNNRDESTKSYAWGKEHEDPLQDMTFIPAKEEIQVEYEPGDVTAVEMHDGSVMVLKKLGRDYDPTDRLAAFRLLEEQRSNRMLMTGLIYYDPNQPTLYDMKDMVETPLALLPPETVRPSPESLEKVMADFR